MEGKHCRGEDGDGGSLADVISNLLTGPVYEWILWKVIGPQEGGLRNPRSIGCRCARSKDQGRIRPPIDPSQVCSLDCASSLTGRKGEFSSGPYTKSFFQYSLHFTLATLPPRRR